jgi:hypothetical protein
LFGVAQVTAQEENNVDYFPGSSSRDLLSRCEDVIIATPLQKPKNDTRAEEIKKETSSVERNKKQEQWIQRRRRWARTTFKLRRAGENPPFRRANHVFRHRHRRRHPPRIKRGQRNRNQKANHEERSKTDLVWRGLMKPRRSMAALGSQDGRRDGRGDWNPKDLAGRWMMDLSLYRESSLVRRRPTKMKDTCHPSRVGPDSGPGAQLNR